MFAAKKRPDPPNILLILADDLPAWTLGCYGNKEFRTPQIDTLSRMGVRFINSFCNTPICSASRATLLTGRLPRQHGIHDFLTGDPIDSPPQGQKGAPESFAQETLLSDVLAGQGYNCGYVGKWHLGGDAKPGHHLGYTYTMHGGSQGYTDPAMYLNGEKVNEQGYMTDLMTRRALEYLDQQQAGKPFFLTVGYFNPHVPYEGHPQKYYDMYAGAKFEGVGWERPAANALREKEFLGDIVGNLRRAAAATTALDDQIPPLLRKLEQRGLRDNTLVIFTSDNGFLFGRHGLWSKGHASDPINMYEEVIGVPMIWVWPGKLPPQGIVPELVSFVDFVPSICEVSGAPVPTRGLAGRSYLPLARRSPLPKSQPWRNQVYGHFRNTEYLREPRFKLVLRDEGKGPNELFDLANDAGEKINLHGNPQYVTVVERLGKDLATWRRRT